MNTKSFSKKLVSVVLAILMFTSVFTVGFGGMIAEARNVEISGGAEGFIPFKIYQREAVTNTTNVNTAFVIQVTDANYQLKINSVEASSAMDNYSLNVAYTKGTVLKASNGATQFAVTGTIENTVNSPARYELTYDLLDSKGNAVWENLTAYTYGTISAYADLANGKYNAPNGKPGTYYSQDSNNLTREFDTFQYAPAYYINVPSDTLAYRSYTHRSVAWGGDDSVYITPVTTGGNALATLSYSTIEFPGMKWIGSGSLNNYLDGTWMSFTDPGVSGYWEWSYDIAGDATPQNDTNYTGTTAYFMRKDTDRANALALIEDIIGANTDVTAGYYVQKHHYTDASWNALMLKLNEAAQVVYAAQSQSSGYRQACELATNAYSNLKTAFANLVVEHDFEHSAEVETSEPLCIADGEYEVKCLCGLTQTHVIPALGHEYALSATEPTCLEQGYTTYTCTRRGCDQEYVADYTDATGHTELPVEGREPTCTEDGITNGIVCRDCDFIFEAQEVIPATGHNYVSVVTAPTCLDMGYTTYTCTYCDDEYVDDYTDALGHTPDKLEIIDLPEINGTLIKTYCSVCGELLSSETVSKDEFKVVGTIQSNGNTVLTGVVRPDYSASVTIPHGAIINVGEVTGMLSMTDIASLGISGTKTFEKTLFTGINKTVELDKYLPDFSEAQIVGRIDGLEYGYTLTGSDSEENFSINAVPQDEAKVKAAWAKLTSHIAVTEKSVDDSFVLVPGAAYIQIGTERLTFEDVNSSLKLDNIIAGSGITSQIRASVKLEDVEELENAQAEIFLPKGTVISLGQTEATLSDDATIRIYGYQDSADVNNIMSALRDCTTTEEIIKTAVLFISDFATAVDNQTVTVDVEFAHIATGEWVTVKDPSYTEDGLKVQYCTMCGGYAVEEILPKFGVNVSGTVTTDGPEEYGSTTIELTLEGETEPAYSVIVDGTDTQEFSIDGVVTGTYIVKASKENHVTREYTLEVSDEGATIDMKIHLLGDINGDGNITTADVVRLNAHLRKTNMLTGYNFDCVDISKDGNLTTSDLVRVNAHLRGTSSLWK